MLFLFAFMRLVNVKINLPRALALCDIIDVLCMFAPRTAMTAAWGCGVLNEFAHIPWSSFL